MKRMLVLTLAGLIVSGPALAAKPVVGVAEFKNEATGAYWWSGGVGQELAGMLANELVSSGKFSVVERNKVDTVLKEQDLAASGRIAKGTGAKMGKMTGAQYMVMGTVSAFERNVQNTGGGFSFKGISIGGKKDDAYIAVDLRVVNTTTGAVQHARTVEARSGGMGMSLGVFRSGFGGRLANEKRTPAGKAIRAVIVEIVDYLGCAMVDKGGCMAEYDAKEQKRKQSLKDKLKLDGP